MVRNRLCNERPEFLGMIMLLRMTKLVHYQVVLQFRRKEGNAVVKGKIAGSRTASPPRLLVANGDSAVPETVVLIEM